jgi:hypothetical protein
MDIEGKNTVIWRNHYDIVVVSRNFCNAGLRPPPTNRNFPRPKNGVLAPQRVNVILLTTYSVAKSMLDRQAFDAGEIVGSHIWAGLTYV